MKRPVDVVEQTIDRALLKKNNSIKVAEKIMRLAKDHILMHMRFLDVAMSEMETGAQWDLDAHFACDGKVLRYDPVYVIEQYKSEQSSVLRAYLHTLMHMIFAHPFLYEEKDERLWDIACDIAVEHTVLELGLPGAEGQKDSEKKQLLDILANKGVGLSAQKLYRYFKTQPLKQDVLYEYESVFRTDEHRLWKRQEQIVISDAQWKKLAQRIQTELKSFSNGKSHAESLLGNLMEATKERVNYEEFLKRFMVSGEVMKVNEDEFDYISYHYGLEHYGNMPLIEPLEYREVQKVHDFVIALDTSASCSGMTVQAFLQKTYEIMNTTEAFFDEMNVHIIQCDSRVREDAVIRNRDDFMEYIRGGRLVGGGATDFRPVFAHVDEMLRMGELTNLKGLIYFTDGYGVFPQKMPEYETVFVFIRENEGQVELPPWAVRIVLDEETLIMNDSDGVIEDEY